MLLAFLHSTALRRRLSWLAVLAVMLHASLPVVAQAHGTVRPGAVEVCSVSANKLILTASEMPAAPKPAAEHHPHCPVCAGASAAALPSRTETLFFAALQAVAPPHAVYAVPARTPHLIPAPRGPPARS